MTYEKIINFLKDKSLLIAIMVITFIVLIDNKSYVYIGPDTFRIEKRPQKLDQLRDKSTDNILSDRSMLQDSNSSILILQELK